MSKTIKVDWDKDNNMTVRTNSKTTKKPADKKVSHPVPKKMIQDIDRYYGSNVWKEDDKSKKAVEEEYPEHMMDVLHKVAANSMVKKTSKKIGPYDATISTVKKIKAPVQVKKKVPTLGEMNMLYVDTEVLKALQSVKKSIGKNMWSMSYDYTKEQKGWNSAIESCIAIIDNKIKKVQKEKK